jgi:hypothetical protein
MEMSKHVLVSCKQYGPHKNVLFVMRRDDDRLDGKEYKHVANGVKTKNTFEADDNVLYDVLEDWSVRKRFK